MRSNDPDYMPSPDEFDALIVWRGDKNDPYFDRSEFARAVWSKAWTHATVSAKLGTHEDALLALVQPAVSEEAERAEFLVMLTFGDDETMCAASAEGPRDRALAEAMNYARQYVEEGPVEVFEVVRTSVAKLARAQSSSKGDEGMQHER